MGSPEVEVNHNAVPTQPDIAGIAEAEEKERIVDQQGAASAAREKRAQSPERANQGASNMAPADDAWSDAEMVRLEANEFLLISTDR